MNRPKANTILMCTTQRSYAVVWHANVFGGARPEVTRMF